MTNNSIAENSNIQNVDFNKAISERYLSYALSTIMSRSLPDVRDGLKPVHRRLLYAMLKLKLEPNMGYKKCARVVGDVIGKYHPHGDTAVYDTLVRLAQSFSLRYPLIDGQGNFGSIDGDNAAAMRYTESRMTEICTYLMKDLEKDTVDFRPTYDDSDEEPVLFPASFPNLLANGSEGIAVGMATSIPPHNLEELCNGLIYLIDNIDKDIQVDDLLNIISGPDFPTGGIIIDNQNSLKQAYLTGKGGFKVRGRWDKEVFSHGLYHIVITEIPYQIQKSKLIEQIANLLKDKKIPLIQNIRDESTEDIRIIIEPRGRNCSPEMVMESLFKQTMLESRVQLNLNVLGLNSIPKVMSLLDVLNEFLSHRKEVVTRRTNYLIDKIEKRLEILRALKVAYLNLDEIIRIIREEDDPKEVMMSKFMLNDVQAEAILNMKLRSLRKLEEHLINDEYNKLEKDLETLRKIISSDQVLMRVIKDELNEIKSKFGKETEVGKRRTSFEETDGSAQIIDISAFIEREPLTIICSKMGWIRSMKGHKLDLTVLKYKDGDDFQFFIETYTTDNILIFASDGRVFTILADNISRCKGHGESVRLLVDIVNADIVRIMPFIKGQKLLFASSIGKGFITLSDDVISQTKSGKHVMNVTGNNKCIGVRIVDGDMIACIGTNRKLVVFGIDEVPTMKKGQGATLQKYRDSSLSDFKIFNSLEGLSWNLGNKQRLENNIMHWRTRRGSIGKMPPTGFPKNNQF